MLKDDGDIIKALGYVALYAAYAEEVIDECTSILSEPDKNKPKNLYRYPISKKIEYLKERISLKPLNTELITFPALLDYVEDLFKSRNEIIHGRIYGNTQGTDDILRSAKPTGADRGVNSAELYDLANCFFSTLAGFTHASYFSLRRYNAS